MTDPAWVAALFAVDPAGLGGVALRALPGPARDGWLAKLRSLLPTGAPVRRVPVSVSDDRLLGGLDLAATLRAGRPVVQRGVLADADGGIIVLAMAERVTPLVAGRLCAALDVGHVTLERDGLTGRAAARIGVIALDEGMAPDERPPASLLDRMAFLVDLHAGPTPRLPWGTDGPTGTTSTGLAFDHDSIAAARELLPHVTEDEAIIDALCATALALGIMSVRASLLALRAARAAAALNGRRSVTQDDAVLAGRLVLAPRAISLPEAPQEQQPEQSAEPDDAPEPETPDQSVPEGDAEGKGSPDIGDLVLAAAQAAVPAGLLSQLRLDGRVPARAPAGGKAGALQASRRGGRPIGARRGEPRSGARLDLLETLRAAAPWQTIRRREAKSGARIEIRRDDFRVVQFQQRTESTAIFVVDASGSSALNRLAEAKGAVELLLADCYVRRDQVALLAFRGASPALLLPPTSSLVRAKRSLASLAGGGGTPLAGAIDAAMALADQVRRRGQTPFIILMTDGRANIARDGTPGRARAGEEALQAARMARTTGVAMLLIDTSPKPQPTARTLADASGATYLPLPYANAATMSRVIRDAAPR